ncbi:PREDICTED: histone-binding protein N1/N2-like isoform X2 [Polistes dominula]|nr:PREDICTED: histone-binding protein N1/N2-like isoform X2 [Polistes dominula]
MADIPENVPFTDPAIAVSQGRRHLLVRDYTMAVTALAQACELLAKKHGDTADELGEPYLLYGRALLGLAREETGVLGGGVPGSEEAQGEEDAEDDDEDEEDDEADEEKLNKIDEKEEEEEEEEEEEDDEEKEEEEDEKENKIESVKATTEEETLEKKNEKNEKDEKNEKNEKIKEKEEEKEEKEEEDMEKKKDDEKEEKSIVESENENTSKNNETTNNADNDASEAATSSKQQNGESTKENGECNSEDITKEDEEDEVNNLQVAWEVLELAKLVLLKRGKSGWKLLADSYRLLGEVAMEGGNHKGALNDLQGCLDLLEKIDPREPRAIAEIHYQLGLAHSLGNEFDASIEEFNKATELLETRIKELEAITEPPKTDDPFYSIEGEIQELKDLLPEIQEKITDMQDFKNEACKLVIENLKSGLSSCSSNGAGPSSDASNSSSSGNTTSPKVVKPVSDISHLVRKKRKVDEPEPEVPMPPRKKPTPEKAV